MANENLTDKQRIYAALEGRPVDRMPVTSLYNQLYILDHFAELTGKPDWYMHEWLIATPQEHLATYRGIVEQAPFEILQPQLAAPRVERENTKIVVDGECVFRVDMRTGRQTLFENVSGHATDYNANETRLVYSKQDLAEHFKLRKAEQQIAEGVYDFANEAIRELGGDHFILTGGVVGPLYLCHQYVGLTNLFELLASDPDLIDYICQNMLEQNIEDIRAHASVHGDAIYIDDATATSDMISVKHYERFSFPYIKQMVDEVHRLGHKAILIYFGGIADRLDQIAALGADGLSMETSMKGYTNDIVDIAQKIGNRVSLFGNIDPVGVLQGGSEADLEAEIRRQAGASKIARGFIMSTGSPITPFTSLRRVQRFIELARLA